VGTGYANTIVFYMCHHALHVDADVSSNLYFEINILIGFSMPRGGTAEECPFERKVDHRTFPLIVVGTQNDNGRKWHACKAPMFIFWFSVHHTMGVTGCRLCENSRHS
jgi:hypothetical protein